MDLDLTSFEPGEFIRCDRCKQMFRADTMVPEEGDEWECLPCNERENARERAADSAGEVQK